MVPLTVAPLPRAEGFLLELTADKTVEWEQRDDQVPDLDQELQARKGVYGISSLQEWMGRGRRKFPNAVMSGNRSQVTTAAGYVIAKVYLVLVP